MLQRQSDHMPIVNGGDSVPRVEGSIMKPVLIVPPRWPFVAWYKAISRSLSADVVFPLGLHDNALPRKDLRHHPDRA